MLDKMLSKGGKILQKEKGITLIALVVTIVILLILSTMTISLLTGENEKLEKAKEAELDDTEQEKVVKSVFCWNVRNIDLVKLETQVNKLGINTIYVQLPSDFETSIQIKKLIDFCEVKDIDIYMLDGDRDWYMEEKRDIVKDMIDRVSKFNENTGEHIKGIKLDIEFYTSDKYKSLETDEEKVEEFQKFFEANKEFCTYAKEKGLSYSIDLPVWLDSLDEEILEEIIKLDYDHIAYMNYNKKNALENISKEVELAKKYNKKIVNIAELQNPDKHKGLLESETLYNDGIIVCNQKLTQILNKYNYNNLGISYHEYNSLVELMEKENPEEANKIEK